MWPRSRETSGVSRAHGSWYGFTAPRLEEAVGECGYEKDGSVAADCRFTVFKFRRALGIPEAQFGLASSVLLRVTLHLIFQIPSVPSSMPGWATHAPEGFLALPLACWPMGDTVRRLDSREIGRALVSPILLPEFGHGKNSSIEGRGY